jgi:hypothetical protein
MSARTEARDFTIPPPNGVHLTLKRENDRPLGGRLIFVFHVPQPITWSDPSGFRTRDLRIKSPLLYQLSYRVGRLQSSHGEASYTTPRCDFFACRPDLA